MEKISYTVTDNTENQRFEIKLGDEVAYLEYRWYKKDLALMHTLVPEAHEGKGVAAALANYAMEYARTKKVLIMVYCPYVGIYLKRHPEYQSLVDPQYRG
jgi:uncharacterized protein